MMTIDDIKKSKLPVIIFGAGVVGEALFYACSKAKIKVKCFCDNNINKTNNILCGIKIIHVPSMRKIYKDAIILISAADMKDVVEQLKDLGFSKWYPCSIFLRNFDIYQYQYHAPADFVEYAVGTAVLCQDSYSSPDKLFVRSVDIVITERCSLRCRDCSNLMRYYKNPSNYKLEEIIRDINKFCEIIDEVNEFRVIGGEPFMNPDFHLIIERLINEPKVKKIIIYTNGTIPVRENQINFLKSNKILVIITDYGKLSKSINRLIQQLSKEKISYYIQKAGGWTDCAKIKKHSRSLLEQKEIFGKCCAKNTITLLNGNLYRCPFGANSHNLKAVLDYKNDYVNIFENTDIIKLRKKILNYLLNKKYLKTCDYCNGRSFGDPIITPAIQIDRQLEYYQYN